MILNKRTELYYTSFSRSVNGKNDILHSFFSCVGRTPFQSGFQRLGLFPRRDRMRCSRRPFESAGTWAACFAALCTAALSSERKRVCAHAACPCAGIAQGAKNRFRMGRWECNDGTGMKSEKGINKNGTGMVK